MPANSRWDLIRRLRVNDTVLGFTDGPNVPMTVLVLDAIYLQ